MTDTNTSITQSTSNPMEIRKNLYSTIDTYQPEIILNTATGDIKTVAATQVIISSDKNINIEVNLKELDQRNKNLKANRR